MKRVTPALLLLVALVAPAAAASARRPHAPVPPRAVAPVPPARPAERAAARTLDDIHIEGEIPVPQVLFITAREQRRFLEFQHRRYLRTSTQLGQAGVLPGWLVVTPVPVTPGKEITR